MAIDGPFYGCFDCTIRDMLQMSVHLPAFQFAIVRSLDSSREAGNIASVFQRAGLSVQVVESAVMLNPINLMRAARDPSVFCGFDELWLLPSLPNKLSIPDTAPLTSDAGCISLDEAMRVGVSMKQVMASVALGDGCGLNCVTFDREFWNRLVGTLTRTT